jgi:hypothetical protein
MKAMDDSKFDDLIRRKVAEFQPSSFDASALTALHDRMDAINFIPWYSHYRTELVVVTGLVVSTIIILLSLWLSDARRTRAIEGNTSLMESQQREIAALREQVRSLRSIRPDTVYVTVEGISQDLLLARIARLEQMIQSLSYTSRAASTAFYPSIPGEVQAFSFGRDPIRNLNVLQAHQPLINSPSVIPSREERKVSFETSRALERHYHPGIGVRVGPVVELSRGFYEAGSGRLDYAAGAMVDFVLSPTLSIETGAKFVHRFYEVSGNALASSSIILPQVNRDLGPMISADVDSWIMEMPLNIKYRKPISMRTFWVAGIGYSSTVVTKQMFEYDYYLSGDASLRVNESHAFSNARMYPGLLNASLSLSFQIRKRRSLETTLYYQKGLGETGIERSSAQFIGLRSSYWFGLR